MTDLGAFPPMLLRSTLTFGFQIADGRFRGGALAIDYFQITGHIDLASREHFDIIAKIGRARYCRTNEEDAPVASHRAVRARHAPRPEANTGNDDANQSPRYSLDRSFCSNQAPDTPRERRAQDVSRISNGGLDCHDTIGAWFSITVAPVPWDGRSRKSSISPCKAASQGMRRWWIQKR